MTWFLHANRKRREPATGAEPIVETGWTGRLHAIGRLLDAHRAPLRDVALTTTGTRGWLVALAYQDNLYYGAWRPISLTIAEDPTGPSAPAAVPNRPEQPGRPARPAGAHTVRPVTWAPRLRAVGALLDRSELPLRDVCLLEVEGGFVVQALAPSFVDGNAVWTLTSREFAATDLTAVKATLRDPSAVRFAHPWKMCTP
jgi:hypothetical protein